MRTRANWIAREQDVVVLPTPPLPPTKIHRRVFWASMEDRVGSRGSSSETERVAVVAMFVLVGLLLWVGERMGYFTFCFLSPQIGGPLRGELAITI